MEITSQVDAGRVYTPGTSIALENNPGTELVAQDSSGETDGVADRLTLLADQILLARQVITQQINIALSIGASDVIASYPDGRAQSDQQAFNDSVADKVLHRIQQRADTDFAEDGDRNEQAVRAVSVEVQQGFSNASSEINQLGIGNPAVVDQLSQAQTQAGRAIAGVEARENAQPPSQLITSRSALTSFSSSQEFSTSVQVTTREGDVVTIDLSSVQDLSYGNARSDEGQVTLVSAAHESSLAISIEGDLNEKEYESIKHVVEQITEAAGKLYRGKTGAALEKLGELEFNAGQLLSLTMDMSSRVSYQAVSMYRQVSQIPLDSNVSASTAQVKSTPSAGTEQLSPADNLTSADPLAQPTASEATRTAAELTREVAEVILVLQNQDMFENTLQEIRKLFSMASDLFAGIHDAVASHKELVDDLLAGLMDLSESEDHDERYDDSEAHE